MLKRDSILYVLLAGLAALLARPLGAQDDDIRWFDNYAEALQEAKRTQKPLFLEFRCEP